MKKIYSIILCAAMALGLTACSQSGQSKPEQSRTEPISSVAANTDKQESEPVSSAEQSVQSTAETASSDIVEQSDNTDSETDEKTLVVYFTRSSNTKGMAQTIADLTKGDIFEIVPVNPYPEDYTACTEVALEERDQNARPEIQNLPQSVSEYDNIVIGYPIWWHTAPMIIGTFLENYDLNGIDVYPFSQSASMDEDQFAQSMEFVRNCSGNGTVHDGLFTRPSDTAAITEYLEQTNLTK